MGNAKQFILHLHDNQSLCEQLSRDGWDAGKIVESGVEHGYRFSEDEYRSAYRELATQELAAVSGGLALSGAGLAATLGAAASWKPPTELVADVALVRFA